MLMLDRFFKKPSLLNDIQAEACRIDASEELLKQIEIIGLTTRDLAILKKIQPIVVPCIDEMVSTFYRTVNQEKLLYDIILKHSSPDRLKETLRPHLMQMFEGCIDHDYIKRRKIVAHVHVQIGLPTKWYIASFQTLCNSIMDIVYAIGVTLEEYKSIEQALNRLLNLEQQLVLEAYEKEHERIRQTIEDEKGKVRQVVSAASERLMHSTAETQQSLNEMVERSTQMFSKVMDSNNTSKKVADLSIEGSQMLEHQQTHMENIVYSMKNVTQRMSELISISEEIYQIMDIVQRITQQTELLALNATIEAAHAGEHGRGFGVVATEVRRMAEQTNESSTVIQQLIGKTHERIADINNVMKQVDERIQEGTSGNSKAHEFFNHIMDHIATHQKQSQEVIHDVQLLSKMLSDIRETSDQVNHQADVLMDMLHEQDMQ